MGEKNSDRGNYRSIYGALWDDPGFQALNPDAKLVFLYLRTSPLTNLAGIFRFYREAIKEQTGLTADRIDRALNSLCDTHWIAIEKGVVWIRNALKYEPSVSLKNEKHVEAVRKILVTLPKLEIVRNFCSYYGFNPRFDTLSNSLSDTHSEGVLHALSDTQNQNQNQIQNQRPQPEKSFGPPLANSQSAPPPGAPPSSSKEVEDDDPIAWTNLYYDLRKSSYDRLRQEASALSDEEFEGELGLLAIMAADEAEEPEKKFARTPEGRLANPVRPLLWRLRGLQTRKKRGEANVTYTGPPAYEAYSESRPRRSMTEAGPASATRTPDRKAGDGVK